MQISRYIAQRVSGAYAKRRSEIGVGYYAMPAAESAWRNNGHGFAAPLQAASDRNLRSGLPATTSPMRLRTPADTQLFKQANMPFRRHKMGLSESGYALSEPRNPLAA